MITKRVIIDTGPLVAFLNPRDHYHEWTKLQTAHIEPPLFTCEAVLAEACFLLKRFDCCFALFEQIERGLLKIPFKVGDEVSEVSQLIKRYQQIPMSFADACLVRMSEILSNSTLFTLDSDFHFYRKSGRKVIPLISPHAS